MISLIMWLMVWGTYNTDIGRVLSPDFPRNALDLAHGIRIFTPFIAAIIAVFILIKNRFFNKKIFFSPLGCLIIYASVGLFSSILFSSNKPMALYWGFLYVSALLVLLSFLNRDNSLQRFSSVIRANWIIAGILSFILVAFVLMQSGAINSLTFNYLICSQRPFEGMPGAAQAVNFFDMPGTRPTGLGRYAGLAAIAAFCIFLFKKGKKKLWWFSGSLFFLVLLLFSKGKTEIASFAISAALVLWIKEKFKTKLIFLVILVALIGGSVIFYNIPCTNSPGFLSYFLPKIIDQKNPISTQLVAPDANIAPTPVVPQKPAEPVVEVSKNKTLSTLSGRTITWKDAWNLFLSSPLIGRGFQADRYFLNGQHVHNTMLHVLIQAGLLGAVPFILAFFMIVLILFRLLKSDEVEKNEKMFLIVLTGSFAFLCLRGTMESLAYYSADWLFVVPVIAYIQSLGQKYENIIRQKKTTNFSNVQFDVIKISEALEKIHFWVENEPQKTHFVVATGMHGVVESERHEDFKYILNSADMFVPDGISLVWVARLKGLDIKKRISGTDLMNEILKKNYDNFLYGDTENVLKKVSENFPQAKINFYSPPFRNLTEEEDKKIIERINSAKPDILWVGLGLPKQERWIFEHKEKLNVPVVVGVGAAFKFLSGSVKRAPKWIGDMGFEWLWRLIKEPKKIWKRVFVDMPFFFWLVVKDLFF